jgi:uncharacterized repeat protein (TIGR03803 family)
MIPKTQFILAILAVTLVLSSSTAAATENVLYAFTGGADGGQPFSGGVVFDNAGNLYGTTQRGGAHGWGTVFELSPSGGTWTESVLYSFSLGTDGGLPVAGVILDQDGNVYGTASQGGDPSCLCGVVFKLTHSGTTWTETVLHTFHLGADGHFPVAGLAFDGAGNLYGTTVFGGHFGPKCSANGGCGVVFKLTPNDSTWTETVLHYFNGDDGASLQSGVIIDSQGFIYGTANRGGDKNGDGTAFKLAPTGKVARLYKFIPTNKSGGTPTGGLIFDGSGNVYGTNNNNPAGLGAVFELTLSPHGYWKAIALHTFIDSADGSYPIGGLAFDAARIHLYGACAFGGADPGRGGTIFKLTPIGIDKWTETHLYDFTGGNDGGYPLGALVFDDAGNLYGVTNKGGAFNQGVVFQITP